MASLGIANASGTFSISGKLKEVCQIAGITSVCGTPPI